MVLSAPDRGEVTTQLISVLATDTGKLIGDHQAPGDDNTPATFPYAVVYHVTHGPILGAVNSVTTPDRTQLHIYQIDSVGETRVQADWMSHKIRRAITDTTNNPNGWRVAIETTNTKVIDRTSNVSVAQGRIEGELWKTADRYQLMVTVQGPDA